MEYQDKSKKNKKLRANDAECNYVCTTDKGKTCGGKDRQSVWGLQRYTGHLTETPLCSTEIYRPPDCSKKGGYNPREICMQTCNSKTMIDDKESCGLQCISYDFTTKEQMEKKHMECTDKCIEDKKNEPTSIGCFKDYWTRDLRKSLGRDLTIEQCIKKGKENSFVYVGLQHGNECWGDDSIGAYGIAEDYECQMPCSRDHS